jgi:hypothetical protein
MVPTHMQYIREQHISDLLTFVCPDVASPCIHPMGHLLEFTPALSMVTYHSEKIFDNGGLDSDVFTHPCFSTRVEEPSNYSSSIYSRNSLLRAHGSGRLVILHETGQHDFQYFGTLKLKRRRTDVELSDFSYEFKTDKGILFYMI